MYNTTYRIFKEINSRHDMICIESIVAVAIRHNTNEKRKQYFVEFNVGDNNFYYESDNFDTEKEALEFRNKILSNEE